jgi:hypothetical protein
MIGGKMVIKANYIIPEPLSPAENGKTRLDETDVAGRTVPLEKQERPPAMPRYIPIPAYEKTGGKSR